MKAVLALAALLALAAPAQEPALSKERVVLRTDRGDLVIALYEETAPAHCRHFLRLVRKGFYDGTRFFRVVPGFVVQNGGEYERVGPLTPELAELAAKRLQAEFSKIRHVRGILSMAREDNDFNSARNTFVILLGDAPHLDTKYTVFGRLDSGDDVLSAIAGGELGPDKNPKKPVTVLKAFVTGEKNAPPEDPSELRWLLIVGGAAILLGLGAFLLAGRLLPAVAGPLGLVLVFVGFFAGFLGAVPLTVGARSSAAALVVFLSMLALFKLMNKFETPR
ncbi:MAG TPA: peptidylprolyl isomerase [Planctomycetota bacterium]